MVHSFPMLIALTLTHYICLLRLNEVGCTGGYYGIMGTAVGGSAE